MVLKKLVIIFHDFISLILLPIVKEDPNVSEIIETNAGQDVEDDDGEESPTKFGLGESGCCCCCVCLSRFRGKEKISVLPCLHKFHKECIEKWFSSCRKTCPVCRFSMEEDKFNAREVLTDEMIIYFSSFHVAGF